MYTIKYDHLLQNYSLYKDNELIFTSTTKSKLSKYVLAHKKPAYVHKYYPYIICKEAV